ncbi:MAG TPA: alanine racemase [Longilinea sp.]|nr:alanine racemase [Longilinea sp.]
MLNITTPTLVLDETKTRANIHRMAEKARLSNVRFRPHFKTHQSIFVGEMFRAEGVNAITCSSLSMASYFAAYGWEDILVAFSVNLREMETINLLAKQIHLGVLVEDAQVVQRLGQDLTAPVDVWVKIDVGAHRTGIDWQNTAAVAKVLQAVQASPALRIQGLLTHAGHTYKCHGPEEAIRTFDETNRQMGFLRDDLTPLGFSGLQLSVGDTPGCTVSPVIQGVDEIRPGNFVFYDAQQLAAGVCGWEDISLVMACPVVAIHPEREEVVVYGGAVHFSKDTVTNNGLTHYGPVLSAQPEGWGAPIPGAYLARLSQEHGIVHLPPEILNQTKPGDLLTIVPAHSCLSVSCMREYVTLQGEQVLCLSTKPIN